MVGESRGEDCAPVAAPLNKLAFEKRLRGSIQRLTVVAGQSRESGKFVHPVFAGCDRIRVNERQGPCNREEI